MVLIFCIPSGFGGTLRDSTCGMSTLNLVPVNPSVGHEVDSVRVSSSEMKSEVLLVNKKSSQLWLSASLITLLLVSCAIAQTTANQSDLSNAQPGHQNSHSSTTRSAAEQAVVNSLSSLPEADALLYISPQRIFNDAAPKVMPAAHIAKMRSAFDDVKKSTGIDPSKVDFFVIAVRFKKPAADLSFVPPDFMAVVGGDFSADSLSNARPSCLATTKDARREVWIEDADVGDDPSNSGSGRKEPTTQGFCRGRNRAA